MLPGFGLARVAPNARALSARRMAPKVLEQKVSEQNDDSKKSHFILIRRLL
jgi:hypothetical protein